MNTTTTNTANNNTTTTNKETMTTLGKNVLSAIYTGADITMVMVTKAYAKLDGITLDNAQEELEMRSINARAALGAKFTRSHSAYEQEILKTYNDEKEAKKKEALQKLEAIKAKKAAQRAEKDNAENVNK